MKKDNKFIINLRIIIFIFLLSTVFTGKASAAIIYQDTFNGVAGTPLEVYNSNYIKYSGSDSMFLTGNNSVYTPNYALEYYNGTFTSTQGIQFDFTTNFSQGNTQQWGVEVYAHGPGNRSEDIYLHIGTDGGANIIDENNAHQINFPAGYFHDNTTYTFFVSYNGSTAVIYLNGNQVHSFNGNYDTSHSNGSFALQLRNYACIGNLYYTDSTTPLSSGAPSYLSCPIPIINQPPSIGSFTAPQDPTAVNSNINISATFTDTNASDTHTGVWDWGDSATSNGSVTENNGSGTISGTHTYASAGVYTVTLTVTDNSNASATTSYKYIVVYDPNSGFLTGSGSFNSQVGAYTSNQSATGELKFGIQSKYTANNNTPEGKIKLDFKTANFSFDSTSYQWLVITGTKAQLKGTGTINGSGSYNILITALDETQTEGVDKVRIKITDSLNNVIYDNQAGDPDGADPTTSITKGSLKIHN